MSSLSIVVIESPPGSERARCGIGLAAERAADIVLVGASAAPLARAGALKGFCGTAMVGAEALEAAGIGASELEKGVRVLGPVELASIMQGAEILGRY